MRVQLAQQAKELLGQNDLVMLTERIDDVALRLGQMVTRGVPEVLDRPIPRHGTPRGRSWGGTAVLWLASILTEGDHRNVSVETSLQGMHHTLSHLPGQVIEPRDVRDDRLRPRRHHGSTPASWHQIDHDVHARRLEGHALPQEVLRCEATPGSGDHEGTAGGLWQFGPRKEEPTRPQSTVLLGSLEPLGMPRSTEVWSGERADAG